MRTKNKAARARMSSLSKQLKKLKALRADLMRQLDEVDAESNAVQVEYNLVRNETVPVSVLPDEMLAMIFDFAKHSREGSELTISHVSQRWRNIALGTPRLWTVIMRTWNGHKRTNAYLERSKAVPITLFLTIYPGNASEVYHLIDSHIGRCRGLRIIFNADRHSFGNLLGCLSSQYAPLLKYFTLKSTAGAPKSSTPQRIFVGGAPFLTSVSLDRISPSIHLLLPTPPTALKLDCFHLSSHKYVCRLRDMIVASASLRELELDLGPKSLSVWPSDVVIRLPALHTLWISGYKLQISGLLTAVQAPSLRMLHLSTSSNHIADFEASSVLSWSRKFPALHALKHGDYSWPKNPGDGVDHMRQVARGFPSITDLTCTCRPVDLFAALQVVQDPSWPHLQTLQLPGFAKVTATQTHELLTKRIDMGYPITKVLLGTKISEEDLQRLRELAQIQSYVGDWPNSFLQ